MPSNGFIHASFQNPVDQCVPTFTPEITRGCSFQHWVAHRNICLEAETELHNRRHCKSKQTQEKLEHVSRQETISQVPQSEIMHRRYLAVVALHLARSPLQRLEITGSEQCHQYAHPRKAPNEQRKVGRYFFSSGLQWPPRLGVQLQFEWHCIVTNICQERSLHSQRREAKDCLARAEQEQRRTGTEGEFDDQISYIHQGDDCVREEDVCQDSGTSNLSRCTRFGTSIPYHMMVNNDGENDPEYRGQKQSLRNVIPKLHPGEEQSYCAPTPRADVRITDESWQRNIRQ